MARSPHTPTGFSCHGWIGPDWLRNLRAGHVGVGHQPHLGLCLCLCLCLCLQFDVRFDLRFDLLVGCRLRNDLRPAPR
ncbi:hypothetical protein ACFFX0_27955 [Citricoccus parietis]|uniref:Uncharacterized protein n=1 Tax=Citricoccus parietis TaxID=592307 RepID=A0ABV5G791_9MICC